MTKKAGASTKKTKKTAKKGAKKAKKEGSRPRPGAGTTRLGKKP